MSTAERERERERDNVVYWKTNAKINNDLNSNLKRKWFASAANVTLKDGFNKVCRLDQTCTPTSAARMMMIAFITMKSGLVPLIEGLCTLILYLRFEIIGGLCSHLLLFFVERKKC